MELEVLIGKFNEDMGSDQSPPDALLEYAQQIQNFFASRMNPSKLDYYLGLAFPHSKAEGLLGFLERKITERSYDKVKEAIFNLIQFVIVQNGWKSEAEHFYIGFKNTANIYWKLLKETARLQQAALDCLISLFNNFGSTLDLVEFDAKQLYLDLLQRSEKSSYQPTVRGKIFHLLGILGYLGHDSFMRQKTWFVQLFNHITSTLKSQVESGDSHLEVSILHGCIKGLDKLLIVFRTEINVQDGVWLTFQEHLQQMVDPRLSIVKGEGKNVIKRREFQRAALEIVGNHGDLIKAGLFERHRQWFEDLMEWSKSANADDNRIGRRAMYKFLEMTIVEYPNQLKSNSSENEKQLAKLESLYKYFADKFKSVLHTKNANRIELSIAVRGFGMLSNLCSEQPQALEMLKLMMHHVITIIHELDLPVVDKYSGSISVLPTYVESIASILPSLKTIEVSSIAIPEQYVESIIKLTVLLIRFYPDLNESQRLYAHIPVQKLLDSLWNHHHLVCESFIEQVYQQSLLHIVSCPTKAEIDILIESWNKGHPETKKSALSQLGLKPVKSYLLFWKQLLGRGHLGPQVLQFDLLMQWILATIGKLDLTITFEDSTSSEINVDPVQGASATVVKDFQIFVNIVDFFQELMSEELILHEKFCKWIVPFSYEVLAYIKKNVFVSGFYKILSVVFDIVRSLRYFEQKADSGITNMLEKLNIFFRSLGTKIQEFRDDLLFSVLELWLSLPDSLILSNFTALNQTLKTVFITGKSSFPLAIKGIEAVERWCLQKDFPVEEISTIMNSIYPILKTYFITSESAAVEDSASVKVENKSQQGNLKTLIKKNAQASKSKYADDATLKVTQLKILNLIGSFGQFIRIEERDNLGLTKDQRFLHYAVPFQDCNPELYIDDLLPRVLELCEQAVERQTRISACEFFHTICLIFIGKSQDYKENLFRRLFRSVIKLGCDSDIVVRQLFNPLCLQIIHWFSKRSSPYGLALMDVLTENLTQHEDLNRRELAALCFGEYFLWSTMHQPTNHDSDGKAKGVIKSIIAMSTHASPNYRQGSVMAFNSIYKDFREDLGMTSEFSFNLLFSFLTNLKLSKNLPLDCLLITSTKQAINHLERIFTKNKDRFNTALRRHFKPVTSETPCLEDVVNWLVCEAGNEAKVYREECLRLIHILCPLTKGFGSVENYLANYEEKNGDDVWMRIAERNANSCTSNTELLSFLDTSSTVYEFLWKHRMLRKSMFLNESRSVFCDRVMSVCTNTYHLSAVPFDEEEKMQLLKVFSRMGFAWKVLDDERLTRLWTYSMELSKNLTGFESSDVIDTLIKVWCIGELSLTGKLQCTNLLLFNPVDTLKVNKDQLIFHLKESVWYRDMAENGFTSRIVSHECTQKLCKKLWDAVSCSLFKQSTASSSSVLGWEENNLSQNEIKLLENYLVTALCLGMEEDVIVEATFDATSVSCKDGTFQLVQSKGSTFQKHLMAALVYSKKLFQFDELLREKPIKDVGDFIQRILKLIKSNRVVRKQFGESVFRQTIDNWKMISTNCDVTTSIKIFVGLLAVNIDACRNSEELSNWWNGPSLIQALHLDLKQKAEVFGYIKVFAASRKRKTIESIMKTITYIVETAFRPEENWKDVEQYVTHIFRTILKVFEQLPKNTEIVGPILRTLAKVSQWLGNATDHDIFRLARDSVEKVVKADVDTVNLVSHIYKTIASAEIGNNSLIESTPVWKSFLLPAVSTMSLSATKSFFKKHIYEIIQKMEMTPNNIHDWTARTISVHLLELLVYRTSGDFIKGQELADAYIRNATPEEVEAKSKGEKIRIVYRCIVTVCVNCIIKSGEITKENLSLRKCIFSCNEACYNTLVATLIVTKGEFRFFSGMLFCGKMLFEKLVDDSVNYEFPVFMDEENHKLGLISNKKRTKRSLYTLQDDEAVNFLPGSGTLSGSSLAPEATSYDFTTSVTIANSSFYQRIFANDRVEENKDLSAQKSDTFEAGEKLEWNEVNKHGCMFAYVETLKQMAVFHHTKQEEDRQWVTTLVKILSNPRVHNCIKTFIVGGILNTPESVEPFAAELVEPIIQLILEDCFGRIKLNHFVQDVIITLLSWIKTPGTRPSNESVTSILKYILVGVKNEEISKRKDVLNHVMEILQNVVRYWAPGEENVALIPSTEIYQLGPSNPTEESSVLRLNVCLSILRGGQLPHTNVTELMKVISKSATSKYKAVHVTASKCIGVLLRKVEEEAKDFLEEHLTTVGTKLENIAKTKPSIFAENLTAIQNNYPAIMTQMKNNIMDLFRFPKVRSELLSLLPFLLKQLCSEVISQDVSMDDSSSSRNCADEFVTDIDGRGLYNLPCKTNGELGPALDLFAILIENCSQPSRILKMVDWLKNAETSDSNKIKTQFADCLAKLYERLVTEAAQTSISMDSSVKQSFLKSFIRMYEQDSEEVHEIVNRFWANVLQDWDQSPDLMLELLDLIGQEEHPLNVLVCLILQRCSLAPVYSKHIFQEPLENCDFYPLQLDTSWRLRHSTFQPLFAESLSSIKNFGTLPRAIQSTLMSQRRSVGKFGMNVLRATLANLRFTPTQQQIPSDSMSDFNEMMEVDQVGAHLVNSDSRLVVSSTNSEQSNGNQEGTEDSPTPKDSTGSAILKLRRKFYAHKDSTFYATRVSEVRTDRAEEARDLLRSRVSGVKTVRSYRIGELPDILIRHSDVLNTLLKLAKQDENFGRQFLMHLFLGMVQEMQSDPRKIRKFLSKAKDIFDRVFRNIMANPDRSLSTLLMELSITNSITLPTSIVLDVCKLCNLQALGILKLEQELLEDVDSSKQPSKRSRQASQSEQGEDVWLGLAELYKEIEEYNSLRNIFRNVERSTTNDLRKAMYANIGNALHWQGKGFLDKAVEMYDGVLDQITEDEISTTGKLFLEDSLLNCVAELGDWDTLYQLTTKFSTDDAGFQNHEILERIVPLQMLSGMQLTLRQEDYNEDNVTNFHTFLEENLQTEKGTHFLTSTYPFDIGVWLLLENDEEYFPQVKLMLERGNENIIKQLKNMDTLPFKIQRHIIVSLQESSVLQDFCAWKKHGQTLSLLEKPTQQLLLKWNKSLTHQPAELRGNNLIASYRDSFLTKIGVTLNDMNAADDLLMSIQEQRVDQDIWLADIGALYKNFSISRDCLARLKRSGREDIRPVAFRKSLAKSLAVFTKMFEPEDWCKRWKSVWKKLGKLGGETDVNFIKIDLLECLAESIRPGVNEESSYSSLIRSLSSSDSSVTPALCLLNTVQTLVPHNTTVDSSQQNVSMHSKLFYLLKKLTNIQEDTIDVGVAETMLSCILRACTEHGDSDEMLLLSNIFPMLKQFPSLNSIFDVVSPCVPLTLFIPWIDQIVSAYKSFPQEYACFKDLINRLVKSFPHAFQLQYPEYLDRAYQSFGNALKAVVLPFKLHEEMVGNILYERDEDKRTILLNKFQATLQDIINNSNKFYGEYHLEYANEMFEIVNRVLAEVSKSSQSSDSEGSQKRTLSQSWSSAKIEIQNVTKNHENKVKRHSQRIISLEKLSPFLANFHFFEHVTFEKPGLYENFKRINIQEHPLIVSFHPTVQYYNSLTRPIRLTIITNNGQRSNFLSKIGDDLRQDRRIQQLFKMSNVLFQKDVALKKRNLSLGTYSCISITSDFGLIEMVDNVMSLVEVIFDSRELLSRRETMRQDYENWMKAKCSQEQRPLSAYDHYRIAAKNVGRKDAETFYSQLVEKFPKYTLCNNLRQRSNSLQEFFSVRESLVASYGSMCMVHWLLGIGDRHLENCILSMSSGKLVGIDFGRAFGTCNYVIPIPEMVPYRLTPQLQQMMMPYSYKGVFRESCIQTWNCLVDASEVILTVANVFIQEPTLDWLKLRQGSKSALEKVPKGESEDIDKTVDREYFPFEILKRKLVGHNPTHLLLEELRRHNRKDVSVIYSKIVEQGRTLKEKKILSSEEYVDVLLDLATDKHILSKIYSGWNSWV